MVVFDGIEARSVLVDHAVSTKSLFVEMIYRCQSRWTALEEVLQEKANFVDDAYHWRK